MKGRNQRHKKSILKKVDNRQLRLRKTEETKNNVKRGKKTEGYKDRKWKSKLTDED